MVSCPQTEYKEASALFETIGAGIILQIGKFDGQYSAERSKRAETFKLVREYPFQP